MSIRIVGVTKIFGPWSPVPRVGYRGTRKITCHRVCYLAKFVLWTNTTGAPVMPSLTREHTITSMQNADAGWLTDFILWEEVHAWLVATSVAVSDSHEQRHVAAVLLHELLHVALLRGRRPVHQLVYHRRHCLHLLLTSHTIRRKQVIKKVMESKVIKNSLLYIFTFTIKW